jgi:hypothetical protein
MLFLTRPFWGFRDLIPYALAKRALAEISHASTSAVSTAAATAGLPFTAKILAATTALPHAHFVPVVVLSMSAVLLAVMCLVPGNDGPVRFCRENKTPGLLKPGVTVHR